MKKIAVTVVLLAFILSLCSGCIKLVPLASKQQDAQESAAAGQNAAKDDEKNEQSDNDKEEDKEAQQDSGGNGDSFVPGEHPQAGFSNYQTAKGAALERLSDIYGKSDELVLAIGFSLLSASVVDLSLMSISVLGEDPKAAASALGIFGYTDIDIQSTGNAYRLTYTDSEGVKTEQTCEYDAAKDHLKTILLDENGQTIMFFEYVRNKDTYTSQYYYMEEGSAYVVKCHFDKGNIAAFGTTHAAAQPDSIIGGSGFSEEFVKNDEFYTILKDGKLFVFKEGKEYTN